MKHLTNKMKNIHILPTDKSSRLYLGNNGNFVFGMMQTSIQSKNDDFTNQNIYITSDEQLKYNDYYTVDGEKIYYCNTLNPSRNNHDKKIILTTDKDLIKDGVQAIDDEFLEWFVKNPSCEKVEFKMNQGRLSVRYFDYGGNVHITNAYKIIIPSEKPKTFKELFSNTGIEPTTDENGNIQYNFKATMKEEPKPHSFCETPKEKCTMNYCDENGCMNRKRELVEPKQSIKDRIMSETSEEIKQKARDYGNFLVNTKQETLEEVAEKQCEVEGWGLYEGLSEQCAIKNSFKAGAKWQEQQTIEEVFEWLTTNNYLTDLKETLIENFKNR